MRGKVLILRLLVAAWVLCSAAGLRAEELAKVYPAPAGEPVSQRFSVKVEGQSSPVYLAHVKCLRDGTPEEHKKYMELEGSAGFTTFDLQGKARVVVTYSEKVSGAKILPTSYGIVPEIAGNTVSFVVTKPGQITVEVNGDWNNSLHVFVNAFDDAPNLKDPNLIYFGPGLHTIDSLKVGSGKTVYIAGGAVVYGKITPGHEHQPAITLEGSNITLRGRGILDGSLHIHGTSSANLLYITGDHIDVEGIVLRESSTWTVPVQSSHDVRLHNIKVFGSQDNSDGVDIVNSQNVEVSDSFLRTYDDLIVVKTKLKDGQPTRDVKAMRNVLWNEKAHALSIGAEIRRDVENVVFSDSDVIHDKGRDWLFRVYNCDSATVKHIVWDDIRVEEDRQPFSLWIGKAVWSKEDERGHISDILFRNIQSPVPLWDHPVQLVGFDAQHIVDGTVFEHVMFGGKPMKASDVEKNAFVQDVIVKP